MFSTMEENNYIHQLFNLNRQISIVEKQETRDHLILYINHLLIHDFNKLVQLLYRVDVSEKKLKELLQQNPNTGAAVIIADLVLQRQEEKVKSKQEFKSNEDIPDEEKW
jgi:hypothetical protein